MERGLNFKIPTACLCVRYLNFRTEIEFPRSKSSPAAGIFSKPVNFVHVETT